MSVFNRKKQKHRNSTRKAMLIAGAGVGATGLIGGGLLLGRKKSTLTPQVKPINPTKATQVLPHKKHFPANTATKRDREALLRNTDRGGVLVHVSGKSVDYPDYYRPPVGRSRDSYLDRGTLGKPGGRKRAKKNWNAWDYYKDANKGAYNLRNKERFDSGRFNSRFVLSRFSPLYWS